MDEEEKKEENSKIEAIKHISAAAVPKRKAAITKEDMKKGKLYEVIKALSAMRLCKEDNVPNPVLCRRLDSVEGDARPFVPAMPIAEGSISDIANEVPIEIRGEPCLFQGSIGTAYNKKALTDNKITHILTTASKIAARFKDDF